MSESLEDLIDQAVTLDIPSTEREPIDPESVPNVPVQVPSRPDNYSPPWERLPDETDRAWELFVTYRDLGPTRSVRQVADTHGITSKAVYENYSARYDWLNRSAAWDGYQDVIYQQQLNAEMREMARRHAGIITDGVAAITKVYAAIAKKFEDDPDALAELSETSSTKLLHLGIRVSQVLPGMLSAERLSRGLPTEITKVEGHVEHEHRRSSDELAEIVGILQGVGALDPYLSGAEPRAIGAGDVGQVVEAEGHEVHGDFPDPETDSAASL